MTTDVRGLTSRGATVRYQVHGDGPTILLIHGWACRRSDWDQIIPDLVVAGYRVLALDLPLHGESTGGSQLVWTIQDYGKVIADLVQAERLDDVILVGHSMGGAVALEAAVLLPDQVRQVIGLDCFVQLFLYPRQDETAVQTALIPFRDDYPAAVRAMVIASFTNEASAELRDEIIAAMAASPRDSAVVTLESLYRWDQDAAFAAVRTPVSVLAARATEKARNRYGQRIRITEVALGGHFFLREDPTGTAAALLAEINLS